MDFISSICPITGNSLADTIIFGVISAIAFVVAWFLTGAIADSLDNHNSKDMSDIHWAIRIVVFVALLAVVLGIVQAIHWFLSWPWWGYLTLFLSISGIVGVIIVIKRLINKKRIKKEAVQTVLEENQPKESSGNTSL